MNADDTICVSRKGLSEMLRAAGLGMLARNAVIDALLAAAPEAQQHGTCENSRDCLTCKQRIAPNYGFCFNCHADAPQERPRNLEFDANERAFIIHHNDLTSPRWLAEKLLRIAEAERDA